MTTERHDRVSELFAAVCDLPEEERRAYLERETSDDPALRAEIETLVATDRDSGDFMRTPALGEGFKVQEAESAQLGPDAALVGEVVGNCRLTRMLATGGMGTVYEAEQAEPQRTVAVKVMRQSLSGESGLRRFRYESQVLAQLRHPGIAQVYATGTHQDGAALAYFVMEYVPDAQPITTFAANRRLGLAERISLFIRVCEAVHHGHQKGVIHRDLKPANILVDHEGQPKIIDFGVARATDSDVAVTRQTDLGQLIGTLQYMSPEQCAADPHDIDTRSDVYALGVVLFELLCDQLPYDVAHASVMQALRVIQETSPVKPGTINRNLRGDLETIALKALQKDRERRYSSAAELATDLRRHLNHDPIEARPPSAIYQLRKFAQRNRKFAGAMAGLVLVLIAGIITTSWQKVVADDAKEDAVVAQQEAERGQLLAEAVSEFMHQVITGGAKEDPKLTAVEMGVLTVAELIHRAAATIDGEFLDQPLVEAEVRYMITSMYHRLGEYHLAEPQGQEMVAIFRRELGEDDPKTLEVMELLCRVLHRQGKFTETVTLAQHVLDSRLRLLGEEDERTLWAMSNLGRYLGDDHQLQEAEAWLRRAVEGQRKNLVDEDQIPGAMNNLANVLAAQGKVDELTPIYEQILESQRRQNHVGTTALNNLGWQYLDGEGKPAEAEPLFREALELGDETVGHGHPNLFPPMNGLASSLQRMRRFDEAEPIFRELIDLSRERLGSDHQEILIYMSNLVNMLKAAGRLDEAEPLARELLERARGAVGDDHWRTLLAMNELAHLLRIKGDFDESEQLLKESIERNRRVNGPEHPDTLHTQSYYLALLTDMNRTSEAEELALALIEAFHDPQETEWRLGVVNRLAVIYISQGRAEEAEPLCRELLASDLAHYGENHQYTVAAKANLGAALRDQDKLAEAETLFREAVQTAIHAVPADAILTAKCRSGYGACLTKLARFEDAEEHLLAAYDLLHGTPGISEQKTLEKLVVLYDAWDKPEQAKQWQARLAAATELDGEE